MNSEINRLRSNTEQFRVWTMHRQDGIELLAAIEKAVYQAKLSVTKDDICEITGKHVECASVGDRYCPCNNCQAYLQQIIRKLKTEHSAECSGKHEHEIGGRCLDAEGRAL